MSANKVLVLAVVRFFLLIPVENQAWPVYHTQFSPMHAIATYANTNTFLYKGQNHDVYYRYAKSAVPPVIPQSLPYAKVFQVPYHQPHNVITNFLPSSYSPSTSNNQFYVKDEIHGLSLLTPSPTPVFPPSSPPHADLVINLSEDYKSYRNKNDPTDPLNRPATIHRMSNSVTIPGPINTQPVKVQEITSSKIKDDDNKLKFSERLRVPPSNEGHDNSFPKENENTDTSQNTPNSNKNDIDNSPPSSSQPVPNEPSPTVASFPFSEELDTVLPVVTNTNDSDKFPSEDFDFTLPIPAGNRKNYSSSEDLKIPEADFGFLKPSTTLSSVEDLRNVSLDKPKDDLLDLLDKINISDDRDRAESDATDRSKTEIPTKESKMENRQGFDPSAELPAPFFQPNNNQHQRRQPFQNSLQNSHRFSNGGLPTFPQFPTPPTFQTSMFFPGRNMQLKPQSSSSLSPSQSPSPTPFPHLPGLPTPPQFQTDIFFPGSNRFRLPHNPQQPPQSTQQFPPPQPFPRNFPGGPGPEPENGYNPYHMYEQFPEPPYESEFTDFPDDETREQGQGSSSLEAPVASNPQLDFAQSTLRGVKTEEILNVVERKPVPPDCVYNTVSYGPNGEDCVQRKKK